MKFVSRCLVLSMFLFIVIGGFGVVSGEVFSGGNTPTFSAGAGYQYTQPSFDSFYPSSSSGGLVGLEDMWPQLYDIENDQCEAGSDFWIGIPVGGCTPHVVRSDILEEQNVPVFCQLYAVKINPLIQVSSIDHISFKGDYPEGVAGISFHPARAAIKSYRSLIGSPTLENIGYVVIILKQEKVEDNMEDWIAGNLTATIRYDADEAYGTGRAEYYLPLMSDDEWQSDYVESSFWRGKGFLRAESFGEGSATIGLYLDENNQYNDITLEEGETSSEMYFPGYYCKAGLRVRLNDLVVPEDKAKLIVDGNELWVRDGSEFLDGKCKVKDLNAISDGTGSIEISCVGKRIDLTLQRYGALFSRAGGGEEKYSIGEQIAFGKLLDGDGTSEELKWYVTYTGKIPDNVTGVPGRQKGEDVYFSVVSGIQQGILDDRVISTLAEKVSDLEEEAKKSPSGISYEYFEKELEDGQWYDVVAGFFKKGVGRQTWHSLMLSGEAIKVRESSGGDVQITFNGIKDSTENREYESENGKLMVEEFNNGNEVVDDLISIYPNVERLLGNSEKYGEVALLEQIRIAELIGQFKTQEELMVSFIDKYPQSSSYDSVLRDLQSLRNFEMEKAQDYVYINNENHFISVYDFDRVGRDEKTAKVTVGGITDVYSEGDIIVYETKDNEELKEYIQVEYIGLEEVTFNYYSPATVEQIKKSGSNILGTRRALQPWTIKEEDSRVIGGREVIVREIDADAVAYVSLIPDVKNTETEANFTFRIGIEKRAIGLSPEKAKEKIENLNKTIEKWEDINEKLGNVVKGWKGACFATSTVLMLKNLVNGFSGESLARQKVMDKYGKICDTKSEYKGMTRTQCYNALEGEINSDVAAVKEAMTSTNDWMDNSLNNNVNDEGLFGDRVVADPERYRSDLKSSIGSSTPVPLDLPKGFEGQITAGDATSTEQLRALYFYQQVAGKGGTVEEIAKEDLNAAWSNVVVSKQIMVDKEKVKKITGLDLGGVVDLRTGREIYWQGSTVGSSDALSRIYSGGNENYPEGVDENSKIQTVFAEDGNKYLAILDDTADAKSLELVDVVLIKPNGDFDTSVKKEVLGNYVFKQGGECSNVYKNPAVRYYESGANKGLPAVVPFDLENGWYAYVPPSAGLLFGNVPQGYKASGDVSYFKICNVGDDNVESAGNYPDICQSFSVNTLDKVDKFLPCPNADVQSLVGKARSALQEAASKYGSGGSKMSLRNVGEVDVGKPVSDIGDVECQDFMSPEDCKWLFNACDPVICPASRCNLGGEYQVSDVIQTGIVGSIMLCLPNAKEGVVVPVCLSGIHAGIDGYLSILKSARDCLQENVESGEHIGICDQITSIYMCEFFWRQFAPLVNVFIPKIIEWSYGLQGVRGGGEYLTVQNAWSNAQRSVSYFTDFYAQNAFRAFQVRSVEEAGTEVCKSFVGTSVPGSADLLDSLLEPESPPQFYAWFSETTFTEATVPATSHYKVYFHIYAGNDQGAYYRVYLKDPPASGYYKSNAYVPIKTSYVPKGDSADESIDITAPEGYKKLCVVINNQEHCGFKQVSSDFGLEWLRRKYVEDQATQEQITSEKACISGTPSAWGLTTNPNIQAGAEEALTPEIGLRGIVRICAPREQNPNVYDVELENENGDNENSENTNESVKDITVSGGANRWKDVGYCGDVNVRCWLDTESVKDDLEAIEAIENKSISVLNSDLDSIINNTKMSYEQVQKELDSLRQDIDELIFKFEGKDSNSIEQEIKTKTDDLILRLDRIIGYNDNPGQGTNEDKARALLMKQEIYGRIVEALNNVVKDKVKVDELSDWAKTRYELEVGETLKFILGDEKKVDFMYGDEIYTLSVISLDEVDNFDWQEGSATLRIVKSGRTFESWYHAGDSIEFDFDDDGVNDIEIKLDAVDRLSDSSKIYGAHILVSGLNMPGIEGITGYDEDIDIAEVVSLYDKNDVWYYDGGSAPVYIRWYGGGVWGSYWKYSDYYYADWPNGWYGLNSDDDEVDFFATYGSGLTEFDDNSYEEGIAELHYSSLAVVSEGDEMISERTFYLSDWSDNKAFILEGNDQKTGFFIEEVSNGYLLREGGGGVGSWFVSLWDGEDVGLIKESTLDFDLNKVSESKKEVARTLEEDYLFCCGGLLLDSEYSREVCDMCENYNFWDDSISSLDIYSLDDWGEDYEFDNLVARLLEDGEETSFFFAQEEDLLVYYDDGPGGYGGYEPFGWILEDEGGKIDMWVDADEGNEEYARISEALENDYVFCDGKLFYKMKNPNVCGWLDFEVSNSGSSSTSETDYRSQIEFYLSGEQGLYDSYFGGDKLPSVMGIIDDKDPGEIYAFVWNDEKDMAEMALEIDYYHGDDGQINIFINKNTWLKYREQYSSKLGNHFAGSRIQSILDSKSETEMYLRIIESHLINVEDSHIYFIIKGTSNIQPIEAYDIDGVKQYRLEGVSSYYKYPIFLDFPGGKNSGIKFNVVEGGELKSIYYSPIYENKISEERHVGLVDSNGVICTTVLGSRDSKRETYATNEGVFTRYMFYCNSKGKSYDLQYYPELPNIDYDSFIGNKYLELINGKVLNPEGEIDLSEQELESLNELISKKESIRTEAKYYWSDFNLDEDIYYVFLSSDGGEVNIGEDYIYIFVKQGAVIKQVEGLNFDEKTGRTFYIYGRTSGQINSDGILKPLSSYYYNYYRGGLLKMGEREDFRVLGESLFENSLSGFRNDIKVDEETKGKIRSLLGN